MKLAGLNKELAANRVRPAYLLAGEEPLLRDDALEAIRSRVLSTGPSDFNFERLEGRRTTAGALLDAVNVLPVMAPQRLVLLRDPDTTRAAGKELAAALPGVLEGLKQRDDVVLVICASKVDKRLSWVKSFADPAVIIECDSPRGGKAVVSFIQQEAKRQEVALGPGAAELLSEQVGPQLLMLRQEIAKAALLAGPGASVEAAHVQVLVTQTSEDPIWDLTDAIGEGRRADAISLLARMLRAGAPTPLLLGALASHFRKLSRVRSGSQVPGPPFAVRKLEHQARRYTSSRLVVCLGAIHDTDLALKGAGGLRPDLALERLVLGLSA